MGIKESFDTGILKENTDFYYAVTLISNNAIPIFTTEEIFLDAVIIFSVPCVSASSTVQGAIHNTKNSINTDRGFAIDTLTVYPAFIRQYEITILNISFKV